MRAIPEWIGKSPDIPVPDRVKLRIYIRDGGRCVRCTRRVGVGYLPFHFDHRPALINAGENRETKIFLTCEQCHSALTSSDVAEKSHTARIRQKHYGIKAKTAKAWAWQKNFKKDWQTGKVVRRDTGAAVR